MKFRATWLGLVVAAVAWGGEVVPQVEIDGRVYENVRWGPVNQGRVVVLHSRGSVVIAVEKLPAQYRQQFTSKEPVARGESAFERAQRQQRERDAAAQRERDRAQAADQAQWVVLDGAMVAKSELTQLTGFVRSRAETHDGEQVMLRGVVIELARRRDPTKPIPAYLEMRPGLWQETGERVFLEGYQGSAKVGELIRIWGREQPDRVQEMRMFTAAREPTPAESAGR